MPNWCSNRLVLTGCHREIVSALNLLKGRTIEEDELIAVREGSLSQRHAAMIQLDDVDDRIVFARILPAPLEVQHTSERIDWCYANWGTKTESCAIRGSVSHRRIVYCFDTAWSPPTDWAKYLSSIFPSLGVALHYAEPGNGVYGSTTYRGGVEIRNVDYSAPHVRNVFTQKHFGWRDDSDDDANVVSGAKRKLIDNERPVEGITDLLIHQIEAARSTSQLRSLLGEMEKRGLSPAGVLTLVARYAGWIPNEILIEVLNQPTATSALALRSGMPEQLASQAARMALQRLIDGDIPQRPVLPEDAIRRVLPPEMQGFAPMLSSVAKRAGRIQDSEAAAAYHHWTQQTHSLRRLLASCIRNHKLRLTRPECEMVFRRHQALDPDKEPERIVRYALLETLALSESTPARMLEAICPDDVSGITDLIAAHPNIGTRFCAQLLERPLSLWAQAKIAMNPRIARSRVIVRAMLKLPVESANVWHKPYVHPYALAALATHGAISELLPILEALANQPPVLIDVLEMLSPGRRSIVPASIWAKLFQCERSDVRQRALVLLGTFSVTSRRSEGVIRDHSDIGTPQKPRHTPPNSFRR